MTDWPDIVINMRSIPAFAGYPKFLDYVRQVRQVATNKATLLSLPLGSAKPTEDHFLGRALCRYICKTGKMYDEEFDLAIRKRFSEWFIDTVAENKAKLLTMPLGSPRPIKGKHALAGPLIAYTRNEKHNEFNLAIRKRFPHWFPETAIEKKAKLLTMPLGSPRPTGKSTLARSLVSYTSKRAYDKEFDIAIRKLFPEWFITASQIVSENKEKLLNLKERPKNGTPLYGALYSYASISHDCYDPEFHEKIKEKERIEPGWEKSIDVAKANKAKLLALPLGSPRPKRKDPLGRRLPHYTSKNANAYDKEFDIAIRKRFPHWFLAANAYSPAEKKAKLLAMPLGSPRPREKHDSLGKVLRHYTSPSANPYDKEFDAAIRKRFPYWFKNEMSFSPKFTG